MKRHFTRHTSHANSVAHNTSQMVHQTSRIRYVSHVTPHGRHQSLHCQSHPRTLVQHLIVFVLPSDHVRVAVRESASEIACCVLHVPRHNHQHYYHHNYIGSHRIKTLHNERHRNGAASTLNWNIHASKHTHANTRTQPHTRITQHAHARFHTAQRNTCNQPSASESPACTTPTSQIPAFN